MIKKILSLAILAFSFLMKAQVPVISNINGPATRCSVPSATLGYTALASNSPSFCSWTVTPAATINTTTPTKCYIDFPIGASNSTDYTITCTATNASGTSAPFTKVVKVYNTQVATFLGGLTICQGESITLTVTTLPYSAPQYTWMPSSALSSSSSGTVTANPTVTTTYTVIVDDFMCPWATPVTITVNSCTGIDAQGKIESWGIQIFPNPNKGTFILSSEKTESILIMDLHGKIIRSVDLDSSQEKIIDGMLPGIYFLKGKNSSAKLISVQ